MTLPIASQVIFGRESQPLKNGQKKALHAVRGSGGTAFAVDRPNSGSAHALHTASFSIETDALGNFEEVLP